MEKKIMFLDSETHEEFYFEVIDQMELDGNKYLLVVDESDEGTVLREKKQDNDEIMYELIEDEAEFQRVTLSFMESDDYDVEV